MTWWFVRTNVDGETDRTGQPRISARSEAEGLQRGRKLQTLTFRCKHRLRQECIDICHDEVEYRASIMHSESSDEHGKSEQMDAASADVFGALVRVAGLTVRDGLASPLVLTRDIGTTLGVHARRAQTLQCVHPQCR